MVSPPHSANSSPSGDGRAGTSGSNSRGPGSSGPATPVRVLVLPARTPPEPPEDDSDAAFLERRDAAFYFRAKGDANAAPASPSPTGTRDGAVSRGKKPASPIISRNSTLGGRKLSNGDAVLADVSAAAAGSLILDKVAPEPAEGLDTPNVNNMGAPSVKRKREASSETPPSEESGPSGQVPKVMATGPADYMDESGSAILPAKEQDMSAVLDPSVANSPSAKAGSFQQRPTQSTALPRPQAFPNIAPLEFPFTPMAIKTDPDAALGTPVTPTTPATKLRWNPNFTCNHLTKKGPCKRAVGTHGARCAYHREGNVEGVQDLSVDDFRSAIYSADQIVNHLQTELATERNARRRAEDQVRSERFARDRADTASAPLQERLAELEGLVRSQDMQSRKALARLRLLEAELDRRKAEEETLRGDIVNLVGELEEAREARSPVEPGPVNLEAVKAEAAREAREAAQAASEAARLATERAEALQRQNEALLRERDGLKSDVDKLKRQCDHLEKEKSTLDEVVTSLEAEKAAAVADASTAQGEHSSSQKEYGRMVQRAKKLEEEHKKIAEILKGAQSFERAKTEAEQKARMESEARAGLAAECERLKQQLVTLQEDNSKLAEHIQTMSDFENERIARGVEAKFAAGIAGEIERRGGEELAKLRQENRELNSRLITYGKMLTDVMEDLSKANEAQQALETRVTETEARAKTAEERAATAEKTLHEVRNNYTNKIQEISKWKSSKEHLHAKDQDTVKKLESQLTQAKNRIIAMNSAHESDVSTLARAHEAEKAKLESDLKQERQKTSNYHQSILLLQQQHKELSARYVIVFSLVQEMEAKLREGQQHISKLIGEVTASEAKHRENLRKEQSDLRKSLERMRELEEQVERSGGALRERIASAWLEALERRQSGLQNPAAPMATTSPPGGVARSNTAPVGTISPSTARASPNLQPAGLASAPAINSGANQPALFSAGTAQIVPLFRPAGYAQQPPTVSRPLAASTLPGTLHTAGTPLPPPPTGQPTATPGPPGEPPT